MMKTKCVFVCLFVCFVFVFVFAQNRPFSKFLYGKVWNRSLDRK